MDGIDDSIELLTKMYVEQHFKDIENKSKELITISKEQLLKLNLDVFKLVKSIYGK